LSLPVSLYIGLRHLRPKKKSFFVSLTSLISIISIALGVATLIVVVGVMTGFEKELRTKILGTQSHVVVVESGSAGMKKWRDVLERVRKDPEVVAASPFVYGQAMLSSGGRVTGALIRGIDPSLEQDVTDIRKYMRVGTLELLSGKSGAPSAQGQKKRPPIVLGEELASNLGVGVGNPITIISPVGAITPMGVLPRSKTFEIVGLFRSGFYQYDSGLAFISMSQAQNFFGLGGSVTGVHMRVSDIFLAEKVARRVRVILKYPYWVRSWQQMNRNLFSALKTEKTTMAILLLLVIIVAAFNIVGSLVMVVMEKSREIAILKSMGASRGTILRIFFVQGATMGFSGSVLGTLLGLYVGSNLQYVEDFLENYFGLDILPASVYHINRLPVHMTLSDVTVTAVLAFVISLLATVYPAWRASRVDPVEVLRYG
jgi:lipoprotein-releasing system permease protein